MNEPVPTYGPVPPVHIHARPNRGLELVEFELIEASASRLLYFDQAAAATHAEQVNRALREVDGGPLVAAVVRDEYRVVDADDEKVGFVLRERDVIERSVAMREGTRAQVRTVVEHPWRELHLPAPLAA